MRTNMLAAIAVVVSISGTLGCVPNDYGELHEYNDAWKGALSFDDGATVNAVLRVFVTSWDAERARADSDLCMSVYGALELEGDDVVVAGIGEASHWDTRTLEKTYAPIEGREFLEVNFYLPQTTTLRDSPDYADDFREFLGMSGAPDLETRGDINVIVELEGDRMTGIVTETGGEGYEEVVQEDWTHLVERPIGTAFFRRLGPDAEATFPDDTTVRRAPFEYHTEIFSEVNWGFDIERLR